jgi:L-rhamnose mutarotase
MSRVAFKMKLNKGQELEYKKRHDVLWPELRQLLKSSGISNYSIFLDEKTNDLFGVMEVDNQKAIDELAANPVMKKWWTYMKDLMDTYDDHSPVSIPLKEVFYLQ